MIDLEEGKLKASDVNNVMSGIEAELVSIETDMLGFAYLLSFYSRWLGIPVFSGSTSGNPNDPYVNTSQISVTGVHPSGIGLSIVSGKLCSSGMRFYDNENTLLEELTNYT